jgi:hypothetical protein
LPAVAIVRGYLTKNEITDDQFGPDYNRSPRAQQHRRDRAAARGRIDPGDADPAIRTEPVRVSIQQFLNYPLTGVRGHIIK